jgi:very-short-patch-repair endonuclease
MMPTETLLWEQLRDRRLNNLKFRRQQIVLGYIADFYCHAASLVIEIDGAYHDKTYDAERDKAFQGRCIQVLRVPAGQVETNLEDVLREIAQAAQRQLASAKRNYPPLFGEPKATVGEGRKERSDASG